MILSTNLLVTAIDWNELNAPIKRHQEAEWIKIFKKSISCLQEIHFIPKDTHTLKVKGCTRYSMKI